MTYYNLVKAEIEHDNQNNFANFFEFNMKQKTFDNDEKYELSVLHSFRKNRCPGIIPQTSCYFLDNLPELEQKKVRLYEYTKEKDILISMKRKVSPPPY